MPTIKYPAKDGMEEGGRKQQQQQRGQENEGNATITRSIPGASKSDVAATSAHTVNSNAGEEDIDPRKIQTDRHCPYLETLKVVSVQLENVRVLLREYDGAPVVQKTKAKGSKTDILKPGDVLILLNGKFLFGLQGGPLAVEGLLRKSHDDSDSDSNEIVIYRPPNRTRAQCSYIDPTTNHRCGNGNTKRGSCGSVLCSTHTGLCADRQRFNESCSTPSGIGGELTCNAFIGSSGETCPNPAVRDGKCPDHAARVNCNVIDSSTGEACTNKAMHDGKCCSHGGRDFCSAIVNVSTGRTCTNIATRYGKCNQHGDGTRCTFQYCNGNRCIREQVEGVGNMCRTCSNPTAERRISGCDDTVNSPSTIVLKHMDNRMKKLKSLMTEEQYKVVAKLHDMRTMLMHNNMQDTSTSINGIITNLCNDMVNTHLTDKKYRGQSVLDDTLKNWLSLEMYVHKRLMWSLKCSLRDVRCEYNYGERLSPEKTRQILKAIDVALEKVVQKHGWVIAKLGSGNVDTRAGDNNLYNSAIFDREKIVVLHVDITNNERGSAERLGIGYLAGLGISVNCQLAGSEIPHTSNQVDQNIGLYMMFSRFQSTSVHFAESGILHRGVRLPPGATMIQSSESPPPISEQLNDNQNQDIGVEYNLEEDENEGDCGGADDDDSKTCVESKETDGNEEDSPSVAARTLHSSSKRKVTVASLAKDTPKKFKHSHEAEIIEDANALKSSKERAASSNDNHAKMKYSDNIDDDDEKGVVKLTNVIGQQACGSQFKTPDAKRFQPSTTPSGLSFDSSDYTAGELDRNAKNAMDEQRFGVKNSAFASLSSHQNSCGKVVTPNPSPAEDLFKSVDVGTSTESPVPHGVLPAGVQHPGMAQFPYQPMWIGGYPAQPMAEGLFPMPMAYHTQQIALLGEHTKLIREQALEKRKSRVTDDLARRITSTLFAKHKSDPERIQILNSGLIEVLAGSQVTNYEDPPSDLSELVETLEQSSSVDLEV